MAIIRFKKDYREIKVTAEEAKVYKSLLGDEVEIIWDLSSEV